MSFIRPAVISKAGEERTPTRLAIESGQPMATTQNTIIVILAMAVLALGYFYYQSRQNVVEIKLPSVKIERQ